MYRMKTIESGSLLEVEIYPYKDRKKIIRANKAGRSSKAQIALNERNAKKRALRLLNCNFTPDDYFLTLTHAESVDPQRGKREIVNYLRRVKGWRRRHGISAPLRYIYTTEHDGTLVHHHVVISGDVDGKQLEKLWRLGRTQCRPLDPCDFCEGLAKYMLKEEAEGRGYNCSLGLKQPKAFVQDNAITRRRVERCARGEWHELEKLFKGYSLTATEAPRVTDFVTGYYLAAKLRRRD